MAAEFQIGGLWILRANIISACAASHFQKQLSLLGAIITCKLYKTQVRSMVYI